MFKNYLKITLRILRKQKAYSFINISGLAIGIACFMLIFLYVQNEMAFDAFHQNAKQIYLIHRIDKSPNGTQICATTPDPLPETLINDYPDLTNVVRFFGNEFPVTANGKTFTERFLGTTPAVFDMFTFSLVKGNPQMALQNANSVVVTEELATKYFGDDDPMGKTMSLFGKYDFIITGVLKKIPENSSVKFDMLLPEKVLKQFMPDFGKHWYSSGSYTFVEFSEKMTPEELASQLPLIIEKYVPAWYKDRIGLSLQPLTSIHLSPELDMPLAPTKSPVYLYILTAIALAVLLIACINFMNLSTARYAERAKEIGMRKVLGAQRHQLIRQFLGEAVLMTFLALILAMGLTELWLPKFNALAGKELELAHDHNLLTITALIGFGMFVGIFSGSYPAFFLSAFKPLDVLKGWQKATGRNIDFRRTLVVTQFAVSILLITGVLVITQQLRYMKHHELGFKPNDVLVIPTHSREVSEPQLRILAYLNAIHAQNERMGILSAALSENVPGYYYQNTFGVVPEGWDGNNSLEMVVTSIDESFLESYGMQLVAGRNFSPEFGIDKDEAVLLNETAVKRIGWANAIGRKITYVHGEGPFTVIGVVRDIHFKSLQTAIEPQVYRFAAWPHQMSFLSVRIDPVKMKQALPLLQEQWQQNIKDAPFEYFFVADKFAESYQKEEKVQEIIGIFSLLAILLAGLGLMGLAALTVTQRTKEIGIRKVLGATVSNVIVSLSKDFLKLVLLANLIAWPIAWYAMNGWLQDFAYRIEVSWWMFALAGSLALVIALMTVSSQAIKAALANPVEALRYE